MKFQSVNFAYSTLFLALFSGQVIADNQLPELEEAESQNQVEANSGILLDREAIESTPQANTDLSQLLKKQSSIEINDGRSSVRGGDIAPEEISIAGDSNHQTNYMIGNVTTNNILTLQESADADSLGSGHTSGYFLDTSLLESVEVLDHNIDAEYGNFTGGVVKVKELQPTDKFKLKFNYKMNDVSWNSQQKIDDNNEDLQDAKWGDGRYQDEYQKRFYNLHLSGPIAENHKLGINFSRKESDIDLEYNDVRKDYGQISDNLIVTHIFEQPSWTLNTNVRYSSHSSKTFLNDALAEYAAQNNSDSTSEHNAYGITVELENRFDSGSLTSHIAFDELSDKRESDTNYLRVTRNYIDDIHYNEGSYGNLEQAQRNIQAKSVYTLNPLYTGEVKHKVKVGAEYLNRDGTGKRDEDYHALGYQLRTTYERISSWNIYSAGEYQTDAKTTSIFVSDEINWSKLTANLGARVDQLAVFDDTVFSPRASASWDFSSNNTNVVTVGASRYHSGSLLGQVATSEARALRTLYTKCTNGDGDYTSLDLDDYSCDRTIEYHPYDLKTADVPYSNELNLGWKIQQANWVFDSNYTRRAKRKGLGWDRDELTNNGRSDTDIVTLKITNDEKIAVGPSQLSLGFNASYFKSKGTGSVGSQYDDRNDLFEPHDDDYVILDGDVVEADELENGAYNSPVKLSASANFVFPAYDLSINNNFVYKNGRKSTIYLGISDAVVDGEDRRLRELESVKLGSVTTWDATIDWKPKSLLDGRAAVGLDITNVLNAQPSVTTYGGLYTNNNDVKRFFYRGREIWLRLSYEI